MSAITGVDCSSTDFVLTCLVTRPLLANSACAVNLLEEPRGPRQQTALKQQQLPVRLQDAFPWITQIQGKAPWGRDCNSLFERLHNFVK